MNVLIVHKGAKPGGRYLKEVQALVMIIQVFPQ